MSSVRQGDLRNSDSNIFILCHSRNFPEGALRKRLTWRKPNYESEDQAAFSLIPVFHSSPNLTESCAALPSLLTSPGPMFYSTTTKKWGAKKGDVRENGKP